MEAPLLNHMMNTNLISVLSMKEGVSIYHIITTLIVMNMTPYLPLIKRAVTSYIEKKLKEKAPLSIYEPVSKREVCSSIQFIQKENSDDAIFNAINYYIIHHNHSKHLKYYNNFSVVNETGFTLDSDYECIVSNVNNDDNEKNSYKIKFISYTKSLNEMKQFVDKLTKHYMYEQKNKLGIQKYFFDEKHVTLPKDQEGVIQLDKAPKNITFHMTPFNTNKSLQNIFGSHLTALKERVNMFIHHKSWYMRKGIPYTLGVLLHGPPGTGKTSIIKAIAKDTNRHVINIKLYKDTTQTQLRNLFFDEKLNVLVDNKTEHFNISVDERIYVIEDIDCLTNITHSREQTEPEEKNPYVFGEELTLSFLLNLLDGILETPGRILIVTTNHIEKLDKAFIRPGRIDVNLEVGFCSLDMIVDMFNFFYEEPCDALFVDFKYNGGITPAELNKSILNHYNNKEMAYLEIKHTIEKIEGTIE